MHKNYFYLKINKRRKLSLWIFFLAICIFIIAYSFRSYDFNRESEKFSTFIPFTLESAMMYSYAREVAEKGELPTYDKSLVAFENTPLNYQMSVLMEYFLGYGYRIKRFCQGKSINSFLRNSYGDNPNFSSWCRKQIRLWISLSAVIIFFLLLNLRCSIFFSSIGGILFSISPAAIARATGQDLIRENFAIPIILMIFLFYVSYLKKPKPYKLLLLGVSIFVSLAAWDMSQLNLGIFACCELIHILIRRKISIKKRHLWTTISISAILATLLVPYLNFHSTYFSPSIFILLPLLLILFYLPNITLKQRYLLAGGTCLCLISLWLLLQFSFVYSDNYSHFFDLIKAKIYWFNEKPFNPELLNFNARILWTPALHSATADIHNSLFHLSTWFLLLISVVFLITSKFKKYIFLKTSKISIFFCLFFVYFILFAFMVRFHALAIPFLCITIAFMFDISYKISGYKIKIFVTILAVALILAESNFFFKLTRDYNSNREVEARLVSWLNKNGGRGKTILADFTLSPLLKAYCNSNIILQPKFEVPKSRQLVKNFLNILYHKNLQNLNNFCRNFDAEYYVFHKGLAAGGKIATTLHPWSNRYIANSWILDKQSPVYKFYYEDKNLNSFYKIDTDMPPLLSQYYKIFKIITPSDKNKSKIFTNSAEKALKHNNKLLAKKLTKKAVKLNPNSINSRYLYYKIFKKWPEVGLNKIK